MHPDICSLGCYRRHCGPYNLATAKRTGMAGALPFDGGSDPCRLPAVPEPRIAALTTTLLRGLCTGARRPRLRSKSTIPATRCDEAMEWREETPGVDYVFGFGGNEVLHAVTREA